jgi:hypothetical protein
MTYEVTGQSGFGSIRRTASSPARVLEIVEQLLWYGSTTVTVSRVADPVPPPRLRQIEFVDTLNVSGSTPKPMHPDHRHP